MSDAFDAQYSGTATTWWAAHTHAPYMTTQTTTTGTQPYTATQGQMTQAAYEQAFAALQRRLGAQQAAAIYQAWKEAWDAVPLPEDDTRPTMGRFLEL